MAPRERTGQGEPAQPSPSVAELLAGAARRLRRAGFDRPQLESEVLLGHLLGRTRGELLCADRDPVPPELARRTEALVGERLSGVPLQYLTGVQEFRSLPFLVNRHVLIPRPETEDAVDACLEVAPGARPYIVDVGTGSGCIAVSLAHQIPGSTIVGIDRSAVALELAAANAARLVPEARLQWLLGDLLAPVAAAGGPSVDVVVSNPPYVAEWEAAGLPREVREHEPQEALIAGKSGLEIIERLIEDAPEVLVPGGWLVLEIGRGQWEPVRRSIRARRGYDEPAARLDFQGIPRIVVCRRGSGGAT